MPSNSTLQPTRRPVTLLASVLCAVVVVGWPSSSRTDPAGNPLDQVEDMLWAGEALSCDEALIRAEEINGPRLFRAAEECYGAERPSDGTFLLLAGQIRSMADMNVLEPRGDIDQVAAGQLYGAIFYRYGGAGDTSVYRNESLRHAMFERLMAWSPTYRDDYNPGWVYKARARVHLYSDAIEEARGHRIAQLHSYSALVTNEGYYSALLELDEISRRGEGVIHAGTPDGERATELREIMERISASVEPVSDPTYSAALSVYEPDPDAPYTQVYTGHNGPEQGAETFYSEQDVRESWLTSAVPPDQLASILSRVDFDTQVLVTVSAGERPNATGTVHITEASYNRILDSWSVSGRVGVSDTGCGLSPLRPFAIAVAEKPPEGHISQGYGISNFPDHCLGPD